VTSVRKAIEGLDYEQLQKLSADLQAGGHHLRRLVESRREELTARHVVVCATCGKEINPLDKDNDLSLEFGPIDLRKRAHFCAPDCLQYFLDGNVRKSSKPAESTMPS